MFSNFGAAFLDSPYVFSVIVALFLIYIPLLIWAKRMDKRDRVKVRKDFIQIKFCKCFNSGDVLTLIVILAISYQTLSQSHIFISLTYPLTYFLGILTSQLQVCLGMSRTHTELLNITCFEGSHIIFVLLTLHFPISPVDPAACRGELWVKIARLTISTCIDDWNETMSPQHMNT